ncbi:MAG TPA: hypothetical protein VFV49_09030 [Thermoanaerobaculia bacterium]|nr:hypothetical protein [Thermoanaerobaculia bacterium]
MFISFAPAIGMPCASVTATVCWTARCSRMPPGQYELLPLVSRSDQRSPDSPRPPGPVSVAVLPGLQTVVMKFTAK